MFGYVMANVRELTIEQKSRYGSVYCGICRQIHSRIGNGARLALSYDMAFLALLHMSLYEPEEISGDRACCLHPIKPRPWTDNICVQYAADMNALLAYHNAMDDYEDEGSLVAKGVAGLFRKTLPRLQEQYPRQSQAVEDCLAKLRQLEQEKCDNPDEPASAFGQLMAQLLVREEDMWSDALRQIGFHLGRYIYLADAAVDYRWDQRKKQYNPFLAMGMDEDYRRWEQYLVQELGRCTNAYERLPLVQDKKILDNILYSGVWVEYRRRQGRKDKQEHGSV